MCRTNTDVPMYSIYCCWILSCSIPTTIEVVCLSFGGSLGSRFSVVPTSAKCRSTLLPGSTQAGNILNLACCRMTRRSALASLKGRRLSYIGESPFHFFLSFPLSRKFPTTSNANMNSYSQNKQPYKQTNKPWRNNCLWFNCYEPIWSHCSPGRVAPSIAN